MTVSHVTPALFHTPVRCARMLCFTSPPYVPGTYEAPARKPRADPRSGQDRLFALPAPPACYEVPASAVDKRAWVAVYAARKPGSDRQISARETESSSSYLRSSS
jgi:hypothetical protein